MMKKIKLLWQYLRGDAPGEGDMLFFWFIVVVLAGMVALGIVWAITKVPIVFYVFVTLVFGGAAVALVKEMVKEFKQWCQDEKIRSQLENVSSAR